MSAKYQIVAYKDGCVCDYFVAETLDFAKRLRNDILDSTDYDEVSVYEKAHCETRM